VAVGRRDRGAEVGSVAGVALLAMPKVARLQLCAALCHPSDRLDNLSGLICGARGCAVRPGQ